MTTITIDTPLKLKKTHFVDALEAGNFLLRYVGSELKKQSQSTTKKKSPYEVAMKDFDNNTNVISLSDYMQKRGLIK